MKKSKTAAFKNAVINLQDMTITEVNKDSVEVFDLMDILKEWDGAEYISFSIKKEDEIRGKADEDSAGEDEEA